MIEREEENEPGCKWSKVNERFKVVYSFSWETYRRATERHLPYRITPFYLPPITDERASPTSTRQAGTRFTYLGGWKAELTLVLVI